MSNSQKRKLLKQLWPNFALHKYKKQSRKGTKLYLEIKRIVKVLLNHLINQASQVESMMAPKSLIWLIKTLRNRYFRAKRHGSYCFIHLPVDIVEASNLNLKSYQAWWERKWILQELMQQSIQKWLKSIKSEVSRRCFCLRVTTNKSR